MSGFTLIELMVTLIIAGVLMAFAAPNFMAFKRNSELTSAANDLVGAISAARGEALKRGLSAVIVPAAGGWDQGWTIFVDENNNQIQDGNDIVIATQGPLPAYFTVTGQGSQLPTLSYIMFDASGYSRTAASVFQSATLTIQRNDMTGTPQTDQTRIIVVAKTGRVRACKPGSDATCTAAATE